MGPQLAFSPWWTRDHGVAHPLRGSGGRGDSLERERERKREREEPVGVLTNGVTWRRSCGYGHTTSLNRGGRWYFDGEMVQGTRSRDWSQDGCGR
jgi:hypothetical protein